jgi:hypothetical protein
MTADAQPLMYRLPGMPLLIHGVLTLLLGCRQQVLRLAADSGQT